MTTQPLKPVPLTETQADTMIRGFIVRWTEHLPEEAKAQFAVDLLRVSQQLMLEAAKPYHNLALDLLTKQPL